MFSNFVCFPTKVLHFSKGENQIVETVIYSVALFVLLFDVTVFSPKKNYRIRSQPVEAEEVGFVVRILRKHRFSKTTRT